MVGQGGARREVTVSGTVVGTEGMKSGWIRECHRSVKSGPAAIPAVRVSVGSGHRACMEEALTVTESSLGVASLQLEGGTGAGLWSLAVWPLRGRFPRTGLVCSQWLDCPKDE